MKLAASCSLRILGLAVMLLAAAAGARAQAPNIYITPDGTTQRNCPAGATLHIPAWFNTAGNWGTGAGQIGPSTIVLLCGTFTGALNTTMFTAQGSGTSGNPITILFDTGAVLTSPGWSRNGAIRITGLSYIVVSGGPTCGHLGLGNDVACNGIIQNTAQGTGMANGLPQGGASTGVNAGDNNLPGCTPGCEIKNLAVINLYVHNPALNANDAAEDQTSITAIFVGNTTGVHVHHNQTHDCGWCLGMNGLTTAAEIDHNNVYNMDHGMVAGYNIVSAGSSVHDNHFHDFANWATTSDSYHHDGIHFFDFTTSPSAGLTNLKVYNNICDGSFGSNMNTCYYFEGYFTNLQIFNNIAINSPNNTSGGLIWMGNQGIASPIIANNTIVSGVPGTSFFQNGYYCSGNCSNVTFENNVVVSGGFLQYTNNTTLAVSDYNEYENVNVGGNFGWNWTGPNSPSGGAGLSTNSLATWQSTAHIDANSHYNATVTINSDGTLKAASPAILLGHNLTSLGISQLNSDINGSPRPATGNWDAGAINSGSSGGGGSPAVTITPSPVPFGNQVQNTSSAAVTVTVTNSGNANLVLSASFFTISGTNAGDFTRSGGTCANNGTVAAGANCTVLMVFRPVTIGAESATLTINGNASGSVSMSGTGTAAGTTSMSITPGTFSYGTVTQGTTSPDATFTLTNTGTLSVTLAATVTSFSGPNAADFALGTNVAGSCQGNQVLTPGATCTKAVKVTPSAVGAESAIVTLSATNTTAGASLSVNGQALTSVLSIAPLTMPFGAVTQGQTGGLVTATVSNAGSGSVTLATPKSVISGANAADWTDTLTGTCTNGLVMAAGATCTIILNFHPANLGAETATLTVNGSGSSTAATTMSGTGVAVSPTPAPIPWIFAMTCTAMGPGTGQTKCKMPLSAAAVSLPGLAKGLYVLTVPGGLEITVEVK